MVINMSSHMSDELLLREKVRVAISHRRLPERAADRTYGGPGCGELCAVCEVTIPSKQVALEIHFDDLRRVVGGKQTHHLHFRCFAAWELERTKPV